MKKVFQLFSVVLILLALSFSTSVVSNSSTQQNNNNIENINQEIINTENESLSIESESEINTIIVNKNKTVIDNNSMNIYYEIPHSSTEIKKDITVTSTEIGGAEEVITNSEQPEGYIYHAASSCEDFISYEGSIQTGELDPDTEYEISLKTTNEIKKAEEGCGEKGGDTVESTPETLTTLTSDFAIGSVEQENLKVKKSSAKTDYVITSSTSGGQVNSPETIEWKDNDENVLASQDLTQYEGEKTIEGTIEATSLEPDTLYEKTYLSIKDENGNPYKFETFDVTTSKGITNSWYYIHWYYLFLALLLMIILFVFVNFLIIKKQRSKITSR